MPTPEDNAENMEICRKFSGTFPLFQAHKEKEAPPHALFCEGGTSDIVTSAVDKGCNRFGCGVFPGCRIKCGGFCFEGVEGRNQEPFKPLFSFCSRYVRKRIVS